MNPDVQPFFDEATNTYSYVVVEADGDNCVIIDPVLGYDPATGRCNTERIDQLIKFVRDNDLNVCWILETHIHADHLSAAPIVKQKCGGRTGIGSRIGEVQSVFSKLFNTDSTFAKDGSQFDRLFADGDSFSAGHLQCSVIHTPGHTPACVTYLFGNCAFVGDTLFMPDFGTARTDFPGGDATMLYRSIQKILQLPDDTRLYVCHDYISSDRSHYNCETTVLDERKSNIHIGNDVDEHSFVELRETRDASLSVPSLLLPSVQVNMRGGEFPPVEENNVRYLKIPVDQL